MRPPRKPAKPAGPQKERAAQQAASESELSQELAWGINPVLEYLESRPDQIRDLSILKTKQSPRLQEIIDLARERGVKIRFVDHLPAATSEGKINHQGVLARLAPHPTISLETLLQSLGRLSAPPLLLALDSVQDPHNLGAIIRSASAAGVQGIILPRDRTAPLSGTAVKTAAGAMAHIDICLVTNLATALMKLKEAGLWIFGSEAAGETTIFQQDLTGPVCLVVGSEGKGLRPLVRTQCDFLCRIPMAATSDSLNASVAAGVLLFEAVRQRLASQPQP